MPYVIEFYSSFEMRPDVTVKSNSDSLADKGGIGQANLLNIRHGVALCSSSGSACPDQLCLKNS